MITALLVLFVGGAPAMALGITRRHAHGFGRGDLAATVRRHRDFLDGLGAAAGATAGTRGGP